MMWRSGAYGYYADRAGPLSLGDRLEASGKVTLGVGPPDSGMYLGWFNSAHKENAPTQTGNFVGFAAFRQFRAPGPPVIAIPAVPAIRGSNLRPQALC